MTPGRASHDYAARYWPPPRQPPNIFAISREKRERVEVMCEAAYFSHASSPPPRYDTPATPTLADTPITFLAVTGFH